MAESPILFRVVLQVSDLNRAGEFYAKLLGATGRRIHGTRHYFDCGSVILALLDPTGEGGSARPNPDYVYFSVKEIETFHAVARELGCLSKGIIHEQKAGEIVTRPWGERSFYAEDPFGNKICFVDGATLFTGR